MTKVLFKRKTSDEIATLPVEDGALIYNHETGATYLDYGNERIPTGGGMPTGDTFPIGAITSYAGDTAPVNWLICDGRAISRTTYADLFDAIGTTYGVGDGSTTFNLPNLKGRVITGLDSTQTEFDTLGETGGEKTHTLTINEMPKHNHEINTQLSGTGQWWSLQTQNVERNPSGGYGTNDTGGGQAHNILQPYITLNYIIKAFQSSGTVANVATVATNSDTDTYSCNYINSMDKYSTDEVKTNKVWIDGKPIYRKVIDLGQLPNNTVKAVSSGLNPTSVRITKFYGVCSTTTGTFQASLNDYNVRFILVSDGNIEITTKDNYSGFYGTVVIEYTKTTD